MDYATPLAMGQRRLARKQVRACRVLHIMHHMGETPLKKRAVLISILRLVEAQGFLKLSIGKEKSRDNCHIVI